MRCPTCGNEIYTNERMCSNCGENNENYVEPVVVRTQPTENQSYYPNMQYQEKNEYHVHVTPTNTNQSSAGLIFGILGLFFFGFIFGILALVYAKNDKNPAAAKVLGIIDIVGWLLVIIILSSI